MSETSLPYNGSSGWSGTDTSRARADHDDGLGKTTERQRAILLLLERRGRGGATWREVARELELHHGQASGSLSNLHLDGRIVMLNEARNRCHVYVRPMYVQDRDVVPHGSRSRSRSSATTDELIQALLMQQELERRIEQALAVLDDDTMPRQHRLVHIKQILT